MQDLSSSFYNLSTC